MAWSRAFQKCIIYYFLDNFFCKHFYCKAGFCKKNVQFLQICTFFADSKKLSNDVSFVIFGHQTWDLEGGQIDPPPAYSGFQVPQQR